MSRLPPLMDSEELQILANPEKGGVFDKNATIPIPDRNKPRQIKRTIRNIVSLRKSGQIDDVVYIRLMKNLVAQHAKNSIYFKISKNLGKKLI